MVFEKRPKGSGSDTPAEPSTSKVKNPKSFVSANRFGCLTLADDDFDPHSSDDENPKSIFSTRLQFHWL